MRFKYIVLQIIIATVIISSCKEEPVEIGKLGPKETGAKRVLMEEFTGVRCVACPTGHAEIENLKALYGENIIAVGIHATDFFAEPYPESVQDFRTEDGTAMHNAYGQGVGFPAALINRTQFDGEFDFAVNPSNKWAAHIASELDKPVEMEISATVEYNSDNREATIQITAVAQSSVNKEMNYVALIMENNIIDAQLTPDNGVVNDYHHQEVLRDYITNINGAAMGNNFSIGESFSTTIDYILAPEWKAEDCEIVVFVLDNATGEVMQTFATHIIE